MAWNWTRPNAEFCPWDGVTPGTSINWERSGWRAALQKGIWGCRSTADSIGASSVSWQPGGQTASWGASNTAEAAGEKRWLSCCLQGWCSLTLSTVCSSGPHNLRRMWRSLNASRGWQQSWWKGWKACLMKSSWGPWVCLVWREGGWGATSLLSTASWGAEMEREVLLSSPGDPVFGRVGMVRSCARGGLDWTLGSVCLPRGWSNTEQASYRGGQCPMPVSVEEAFGQHPQ